MNETDYLKMKLSPSKTALENELKIADSIRSKNKFRVLDVCCRRFPRGFGVDIHPGSNADMICDAHNLKIASKSFDLTLCVEGIEHLQNPGLAVKEWARVTKYALMVTTPNAHCWRRWLKLFGRNPVTSNFHIYLWDEYTFRNFFNNVLPGKPVLLEWYDRYPKKTRNFLPKRFFHENMSAFIWLEKYETLEDTLLWFRVYQEAKRLIESRPERHPLYNAREYNVERQASYNLKGVDS